MSQISGYTTQRRLYIGCAGWNTSRAALPEIMAEGSQLAKYASLFRSVEINSSFHRPHSAATYAKWAASTPADFRFAVKVPRAITHDQKLRRAKTLCAKHQYSEQAYAECCTHYQQHPG